jgi:hypothetical protein
MSDLQAKVIRDKPATCAECGDKTVTEVYASECKPCRAVKFLQFRFVMNWPLDDLARRMMGL